MLWREGCKAGKEGVGFRDRGKGLEMSSVEADPRIGGRIRPRGEPLRHHFRDIPLDCSENLQGFWSGGPVQLFDPECRKR